MQETPVWFLGWDSLPGEGIGYPHQYSWASLLVQTIKNPPTMREIWLRSLGWEEPLEEGMATHSSILSWRIPTDRGAWQAIVHAGVGHNWATKHTSYVLRLHKLKTLPDTVLRFYFDCQNSLLNLSVIGIRYFCCSLFLKFHIFFWYHFLHTWRITFLNSSAGDEFSWFSFIWEHFYFVFILFFLRPFFFFPQIFIYLFMTGSLLLPTIFL